MDSSQPMDIGEGPSEQAAVESFAHLPLAERIGHKKPAAKNEVYKEFVSKVLGPNPTVVSEEDPIFAEYAPFMVQICSESAPVCIANAAECAAAFVDKAKIAINHTPDLVGPAITNLLNNNKSQKNASRLIHLMVEIGTPPDTIIEGLVASIEKGFTGKKPNAKQVTPCLQCFVELFKAFGPRVISPKPLVKNMGKMLEGTDASIRTEAKNLMVMLWRYMGEENVKNMLKDVRDAIIADISKQVSELSGEPPAPTHMTRQAKAALEAGGGPAAGAKGNGKQPASGAFEIELNDPVLLKLPKDWETAVHTSGLKWEERSKVIQSILAAVEATPRIKNEGLEDFVKLIKQLLYDTNAGAVPTAAKICQHLAKAMRQDLAAHQRVLVPALLGKYKEKKASILHSVDLALKEIYPNCVDISIILDEFGDLSSDKVPEVRQNVAQFLSYCVGIAPKTALTKHVKSIGELLVKLTNDSNNNVRTAATEAFANFAVGLGEAAVAPFLGKVEAARQKKVKELMAKAAETRAGAGGDENNAAPTSGGASSASDGVAAKPSLAARKKAPTPSGDADERSLKSSKSQDFGDADETPASARPKSALSRAPAAKSGLSSTMTKRPAPSAAGKAPAGASGGGASKKDDEDEVGGLSPEEAEAKFIEIVPEAIRTKLESTKFAERNAALDELKALLAGGGIEKDKNTAEVVLRYLAKKPGFKEANFQVYVRMLDLASDMITSMPAFPKRAGFIIISNALDKITDKKIGPAYINFLNTFCENVSPSYVFAQMYKILAEKLPPVVSTTAQWMAETVTAFGMRPFNFKSMLDFVKGHIASTNPTVKTSVTNLLITMRRFLGPTLDTMVKDALPDNLKDKIQKEFDKIASEAPPPPPTKAVKGEEAPAAGGSGEDLIPRADISKHSAMASIFTGLNATEWKARSDAMAQIVTVLESNGNRISPNVGDLMAVLKTKIADSNGAVTNAALDTIAKLFTAMGPGADKHKAVLHKIYEALSNTKDVTRQRAVDAVGAFVAATSVEITVPLIGQWLNNAEIKTLARMECCRMLEKHLPALNPSGAKPIVLPLIKPIIDALQDRSHETKKAAEAALLKVGDFTGQDPIRKATADLKPAVKTDLDKIIAKIPKVPAISVAGAASTASTPASTPTAASPVSVVHPAFPPSAETAAAPSLSVRDAKKPPTGLPTPTSSSGLGGTLRRPASARSPSPLPVDEPTVPEKKAAPSLRSSSQSKHATDQPSITFKSTSIADLNQRRKDGALNKRWSPGESSREAIEYVKAQAMAVMGPEPLVNKLFDWSNVPECNQALSALRDAVERQPDELRMCYDVVLKYVSVVMHSDKMAFMLVASEIAKRALDSLKDMEGFVLTDYDVQSFIPFIAEKFNDRDQFRQSIRHSLQAICQCYQPTRLFSLFSESLRSKNANARMSSQYEMLEILRKYEVDLKSAEKALPYIAPCLTDKDVGTKKAALDLVQAIAERFPEDMGKMVSNLPDKQRGELEEQLKARLKHAKPAPASTIPRPRSKSPSPHHIAESAPPAISVSASTSRLPSLRTTPTSTEPADVPMDADQPPLASPMRSARPAVSRIPGPRGVSQSQALSSTYTEYRLDSDLPAPPATARPATVTSASSIPSLSSAAYAATTSADSPVKIPPRKQPSAPLARPATAPARPASISTAQPSTPTHPSTLAVPSQSTNNNNNMTSPLSSQAKPIRDSIDVLRSDRDNERIIDALKHVCASLSHTSSDAAPSVDELSFCLAEHIELAFCSVPANVRLCKYVLNTCMQLFTYKDLAGAMSEDAHFALMHQVIQRLTDPAVTKMDEGQTLLRVLNTLMIRVLEASNRTLMIKNLLKLLSAAASQGKQNNTSEIVSRCLLKLVKLIKTSPSEFDIPMLLDASCSFLTQNPPSQFGEDEMTIRLLKTLLHSMVAARGAAIFEDLALVPNPNPLVSDFLRTELEKAEGQSPTDSASAAASSSFSKELGGQLRVRQIDASSAAERQSVHSDMAAKMQEIEGMKLMMDIQSQRASLEIRGRTSSYGSILNQPQSASAPGPNDLTFDANLSAAYPHVVSEIRQFLVDRSRDHMMNIVEQTPHANLTEFVQFLPEAFQTLVLQAWREAQAAAPVATPRRSITAEELHAARERRRSQSPIPGSVPAPQVPQTPSVANPAVPATPNNQQGASLESLKERLARLKSRQSQGGASS